MEQFDIALGRCTVRDGELVIDRVDPDDLGRWELCRRGLSSNVEHRPAFLGVYLGVMLLLGLVFLNQLIDMYLSNPAVAPLVVGLGIFGVVVVVGGIEVSFRRAMRNRRQRRSTLDEEFNLVRPRRIPLDSITGVTVRNVSMRVPWVSGTQLLIHFQREEADATVRLGFQDFMTGEIATARALFERHGIPIEDE